MRLFDCEGKWRLGVTLTLLSVTLNCSAYSGVMKLPLGN